MRTSFLSAGGPKRLAVAALRAALTYWAQGRGPRLRRARAGERPKVSFLVMHPWGMGGTIRTVSNLAAHLSSRYDVELIGVVRTRERPFFEFPDGVPLVQVYDGRRDGPPRGPLRRLLERFPSLLIAGADVTSRSVSLWTDLSLARVLRERTSGVMIGTRPGLNLLVANAASPKLVRIGQEHMHLSAHNPRVRSAIRRDYPKLDALAVLTDGDRDEYVQLFGDEVRVEAIPNAVTKLDGGVTDLSAKVVIAAGRMRRQKDFGRMIRAFAIVAERHPDWRLKIFGAGPRRDALVRLIGQHGLEDNVELHEPVKTLGHELASASIYALSSRREGFPMVLLEAMSKGLPVVSFDCPTGPREIVRDRENGLLVPYQDVGALAAGIVEMIEDEELRRRCSRGALETAERYEGGVIGARWERLLEELQRGSS